MFTSPSRWAALLFVAAILTACGDDRESKVEIPSWAKVAPKQIAEAKEHGVPVAFETEIGMRFVLIPAGTFLMGSPEDEEDRYDDETQHEVTITKPYYMQITEVTNGQYREQANSHSSGDYEGLSLDGNQQPVVMLSWEDAVVYANRLARLDEQRSYRLPTEAEWEYACRAGSRGRFWWGDGEESASGCDNVADEVLRPLISRHRRVFRANDGQDVSAPVGTYRPNRWGLFDLHGNVQEWCADWYGPYPRTGVVDPVGPPAHEAALVEVAVLDVERRITGLATGLGRVVRGGEWYMPPSGARASKRWYRTPSFLWQRLGFRLVSPLPDAEPGGEAQ